MLPPFLRHLFLVAELGTFNKLLSVMVSSKVSTHFCYTMKKCAADSTITHAEYYTSHPPFNRYSSVPIAAIGTVALALMFGEVRP